MVEKKKPEKNLALRPPVVVVLGHVDHGKSTLLDYIRKSNITAKEHGGITQHIGAYQIKVKSEERYITFIDTPGHEAFVKLRARGVNVADIALLVVAADDSVKPQTKESIKYIQQAAIPFIVAINKVDLPAVNVKKVKEDLLRAGVIIEEKGGKIACLPISAKSGEGIQDLLEAILLLSEIKEIAGNPQEELKGVIIEAKLDSRRGNVATILVKNGVLKAGEEILTAGEKIKVRAMFDENGKSVREAGFSKPVEVIGFKQLPLVGSLIQRTKERKQKTAISKPLGPKTKLLSQRLADTVIQVILKADSHGSLEAIIDGLGEDVEIVSCGIGEITKNDVFFAKIAQAVIIGFNVKVSPAIVKLAQDENVKIRTYQIIYKLFEEIKEVIKVLKEGPEKEILGKGKVTQEFLAKKQRIAGVQAFEGRLVKGDKIRIIRNQQEAAIGRIKSLKQEKREVNKVEKGEECGLGFSGEVDFKIGDVVESFQIKK